MLAHLDSVPVHLHRSAGTATKKELNRGGRRRSSMVDVAAMLLAGGGESKQAPQSEYGVPMLYAVTTPQPA